MTVDARIAAADWYIERGFRTGTAWGTLPDGTCRCPKGAACDQKPGKHPTSPHGFHDATSDPSIIRRLLSAGSEPNLLVVSPVGCFGWDLDGGDAERIRGLESTLGPLPDTLGHQTPNGRHVVYRWPTGATRPAKVLGVVSRWGDGAGMGYLIGAGSRIGEREYRVLRDEQGQPFEIVELPTAWAEAAIEAARPALTIGPVGGYQLPERVGSNDRYFAIRDYIASRYHHKLTEAELWAAVRDVLAPTFAEPLPERGPDSLRSRFERAWKGTPARLGPPAALLSAEGDVPDGRKKEIAFLTARELAAETPPEVPWRVAGILADGAVTELDGKAKVAGKSTFAARLIACALDGRPFLGRQTVAAPVVMLSEQPATSFRDTLGEAGLLERDDLHLLLWRDAFDTPWPAIVAAAVAEAERTGARMLIVDTLPQFAGLKGEAENDAGSALEAVRPLQAAAARGLAVLLVRHDRKGFAEVGESARGSSAFTGSVDIVIRLSRPSEALRPTIRELAVLSRFHGWPEVEMIELTAEGYVSLGDEPAVELAAARAALLDGLPATEPGMTPDEIVPELVKKRTTAQVALRELAAEGLVVRTGKGRKGSPFTYRLADPDSIPEMLSAATYIAANRNALPADSAADLVALATSIFADDLDAPEHLPPAEPTDLSAMVERRRADA